jgi:hypothetical protein
MARMAVLNPAIEKAMADLKAKGYDAIPYEYYHYRTFPAGTLSGKINFFHQVIGDSDSVAGFTLTEEDTNMDRKSEFSYPFICQYLCAKVLPASDADTFVEDIDMSAQGYNIKKTLVNDILKIYNRGLVRISVQNKELLKVTPLIRIPAGAGVTGSLALSSSKSDSAKLFIGGLLVNGDASKKNKFPVEIFFDTNIKFDFTLEYLKESITTYNKLRIGFIMEGILYRK